MPRQPDHRRSQCHPDITQDNPDILKEHKLSLTVYEGSYIKILILIF